MSFKVVPRGSVSRAELTFLVGCIAVGTAIFAPKLMRADVASDEAQAIADLRTLYLAEEAYAAANLGYYSDPTNLCRSGPECKGIGIPGYPAAAPEFLSAELGRVSPFAKDGYSHVWTADGGATNLPASADPDSVVGYCHDASPYDYDYPDWGRSFAVDGSGRMYYDPTGAPVSCPVPYFYDPLETPRPALAVDFGRRGLWRYDGDDRWIRLTHKNPSLVRAWDERLLASFEGQNGLYLLDETGWTRIHRRRATDVVPLVEGLVARLRSEPGLWYWDQTDWTQISPWEPEAMEARGNKLLVDFGAAGLWIYWRPLGWTMLSHRDPDYVRAAPTHFEADLADGQGVQSIYVYSLQEETFWWWASFQPPPEDVLEFRASAYRKAIAFDFGVSRGLSLDSTQISSSDPYLLSVLDDDLLAAFRGRGLYRFEDEASWLELSTSEPTELAPADGYTGALFEDLRGVQRLDDAGMQQITRWRAQSVTAVDLAAGSQSWTLRNVRRCPVRRSERASDTCRRLPRRTGSP